MVLGALLFAASVAPAQQATIVEIEVNQALGRARALDGSVSPVTRFVAGKDTVTRVYLSAAVVADPDGGTQTVRVTRDGAAVATLTPAPSAEPTAILTFACPSRTACGDWAAGSYTMQAKVGDAELSRGDLAFETRRALSILAVPVKANYGGDVRSPDEAWKKAGDFARDVFPIAGPSFRYQLRDELDLSEARFDLTKEDGRRAAWNVLTKLQPAACERRGLKIWAGAADAGTCFDAIIGFVSSRVPASGGTLPGFSYGRAATVLVNDEPDLPSRVAHELAHTLGIGDEYKGGSLRCDVNPPPATYSGLDWDTHGAVACSTSAAKEPEAGKGQGSLVVAAEDRPYHVGGRGALEDSISYMGRGFAGPDPQKLAWTTWTVYSWLYDQLKPAAARGVRLVTQRVLEISGSVSGTGSVRLDPGYTYDDDVPVEKGTHELRALDASGKVLATQGFSPTFFVLQDPPVFVDPAEFEGVVLPFPAETRSVEVAKGASVLASFPVTPNAPTVKVTAPAAGARPRGPTTITWTASDPDGGTLYFDVEYSPSATDDWYVLATGITARSFTEDFDDLPGGTGAQVRVFASDGFNSSVSESDPFDVDAKPPEVFIEWPYAGEDLYEGYEVELSGFAWDPQDEWIFEDEQLAWTSSLDGDLGRGSYLVIEELSLGRHVITLTATNSAGVSASAAIAVMVVEEDAPETPVLVAFNVYPESPVAGREVRFEDLTVGVPTEWRWDFGDGTTSDEQSPYHTFAAAGTYEVKLTAVGGAGTGSRSRTVVVRQRGSGAEAVLFVPVVLSAGGRNNSFFTSEITFTNRGSTAATLSYAYVPFAGGGGGVVTNVETLGAGRQLSVANAIEYLRGKGVPIPADGSRGGTLRVTFSGLTSAGDAAVVVRTTTPVPAGATPTGSAGLAYAGVPVSRLLSAPVFLPGLRQTSTDRSNVAVQNAGSAADGKITLRASVYPGEPGSQGPSGSAEVELGPGEFKQWAATDLAASFEGKQGFVRVERIAGTAPFYAYGVINDQATSDGSFVPPVPASAGGAAAGLALPVVVETSAFSTEVVLTNVSQARKTLLLSYAPPGLAAPATVTLTLEPASQTVIGAFVAFLRERVPGFPAAGPTLAGPLFVSVPGGTAEGIAAGGRTFNAAPGGGTFGVFYNAVPQGGAFTTPVWLNGLRQDAESRSNVALFNTGEAGATDIGLRLDVFDGATGAPVAEHRLRLGARAFTQLNGFLSQFPGLSNAFVRVVREDGTNPFYAYAVVNDGAGPGQRSGDGAFILPEVPAP